MSTQLELHLFGSPQILWQGQAVTGFVSTKARALLIYLAVTGRAHSRDALAELLWADTPSTKRENLRKALSNLRSRPGVTLLEGEQQLVALALDRCWVDVIEFERLADDAAPVAVEALQRAEQLYQADFLAGFNPSLSYEFEAWALAEQTRLKLQIVAILHRLADGYAQHNQLAQAIAAVQRLLQMEPWQEEAHRRLIGLLALQQDVSAALAQFEVLRAKLRADLDVEPSAATLALVDKIRTGDFQPTGSRHAAPSTAHRVDPAAAHTRASTKVEFSLVGRDHEWQLIRTLWQTLDHPHFLCIGGEAGIGKTRLAEELLLLAEQDGAPVARTRSHALRGQLAYSPITDWLRTMPLQAALAQLEEVWLTEVARLLPELLIDRPMLAPPQPLQERWQRKRFFDALVHAFTAVDGCRLLVLDDLQWCDSDTLEWLQYLVETVDDRLLVVGTVRTDEIAPEHPLHRVRQQVQRFDRLTELQLSPLNPAATTALAAQVTEQPLAGDLAERLYHDTAGNPLFIIESMRGSPTEAVGVSLPPHPVDPVDHYQVLIPAKMYRVIQARLAQLSPEAQTLVQLGATIGRAFDVTLLATAAERDEEDVLLGLDELWQRHLIREVSAAHFDFSHDRIREVAYTELSPIKRRLLHCHVADAIAAIHTEDRDVVCGHLAVHYEAAGRLEQAITFYQHAADGARRLFAHQETVKYCRQALHLLRQLPRSRENRQTEIDLLLTLFQDLTAAHGSGSPSAGEALPSAYALAQEVGTPLQQFAALNALVSYNRVRGNWSTCQEYGTQLLRTAEATGNPASVANAQFSLACTHMHLGNPEKAHAHFEQIQANVLPTGSITHGHGWMTRSAHCLWLLGFPDRARQRSATALSRVRESTLAAVPRVLYYHTIQRVQMVLHHHTILLVLCRDFAAVDEFYTELVDLTTKRNDEFFLRCGNIFRGWLLVHQGNPQDGLALIRENADEHRARGNYLFECFNRSLLAEAYLVVSNPESAIVEIDDTLVCALARGDCYWNAYLLKLRGDCLQANNAPTTKIEHCYQLAIDTARQQNARSLELRATISLCRIWQEQGKIADAYQLLAALYGWFTEGFETGDLVEAKLLLDELAR